MLCISTAATCFLAVEGAAATVNRMGYAQTRAIGLVGLEGYPVTVEADIARGLPTLLISGLPDQWGIVHTRAQISVHPTTPDSRRDRRQLGCAP